MKYSNINSIKSFICENFASFGGFNTSGYSCTKVYRILENLNEAIDREPAMIGAGYDAVAKFDNGEFMDVTILIDRHSGNAENGDWEVRVIPGR